MIITAIIFLLVLSILVLIHELGHFWVAKKFGIKIEEFGFGFPPRALSFKKGETIYSINWLPIGGFVKLYGEDEAGGGRITNSKSQIPNKDTERAFFSKTPWQRAAVTVAGVVMNTFLAAFIFYIFMFISGFTTTIQLLDNHKFFLVNQKNVTQIIIGSVSKDSPAEKAGLKVYDVATSINGEKLISTEQFVSLINENKGKEITLSWESGTEKKAITKKLTPRLSPPKGEGALGIGFGGYTTAVLSYDTGPQKVFSGFIHSANLLSYNLELMSKLIGASFKAKDLSQIGSQVAGPVGVYSLVGLIVQIPDLKEKVLGILNLAGLLSISLAFFNILPIPALDGGRLFFILIEAVFRRKVSQKIEGYIHSAGMMVLLGLMLLITFQDLGRIFSGFFR